MADDYSVSQPAPGATISDEVMSEHLPRASASTSSSIHSEEAVHAAPARQAAKPQRVPAAVPAAVQQYSRDNSMSDMSARSAELEAQREQMAALLKAKQQELHVQQRKRQLGAKEQVCLLVAR